MPKDAMYVMSPLEIVWGYLLGHTGSLPTPQVPSRTPRQALEAVIVKALQRPPCGVAFSGGRDSSAVLAVATHVARREGLAAPIAVTRVFPDAPATDETAWQEKVLRHLQLEEWVRLEFHDELDVVGPLATANISRHGVVWPPTLHGNIPMIETMAGGTLLNGEGGDEVLGVKAHRVAPLSNAIRSPRSSSWKQIRSGLGALLPGALRESRTRLRYESFSTPWLTERGRKSLIDAVVRQERLEPLAFSASVRRVPRRRTQVYLAHNRGLLAQGSDVEAWSPLLHPEVVHAISREGRFLGVGDRTSALRSLVPDLLPDAVLARTTKAEFRGAFNARHTIDFAQSWSGTGLDEEMVDIDELRRMWLSGRGTALTAALLQTAWLSEHSPRRTAGTEENRLAE